MFRYVSVAALLLCIAVIGSPARTASEAGPLDCSTATPGGSSNDDWPAGCDCVQKGWITEGGYIPDGPVFCRESVLDHDRCNFDQQCPGNQGGGGGGTIAESDEEQIGNG